MDIPYPNIKTDNYISNVAHKIWIRAREDERAERERIRY